MARDTTRRALFAASAATTIALPAFATGARTEDTRFLAWQREGKWWYDRANSGRCRTDEELDGCLDRMHHFACLILTTPASGIIPASIKTELLLRQARDFEETPFVAPLASILATLRGLHDRAGAEWSEAGTVGGETRPPPVTPRWRLGREC